MRLNMDGHKGKFKIIVDGYKNIELAMEESDEEDDTYVWACKIGKLRKGFHTIQLEITETNNNKRVIGKMDYLKISSPNKCYVARARWRPAAIHCRFTSSDKFWRILVRNSEEQIWNYETYSVE